MLKDISGEVEEEKGGEDIKKKDMAKREAEFGVMV
jgi:hypothetical protein